MKRSLLVTMLFYWFSSFGQNTIGLPDIVNYTKQDYKAGLQSWDIKQDYNGIIYLANNEGLLSFDGKYWNLHPLPNKTIVRSIEITQENRIYTGGQDELGFFTPAHNGTLQYTSLINSIPEKDRWSFGDVWDICSYKKDVFFRCPNKIFKLSNGSISVFPAKSEWTFMAICDGRLFAQDYKNGLFSYENNVWTPIVTNNVIANNDYISAILPFRDRSVLVTTIKNGIYILSPDKSIIKFDSEITSKFENDRIYSAAKINENAIALATSHGGVYILDNTGLLIQQFTKTEGLQNNNVLSIFLDKQKNLWLGLDNGIDYVAYNSAIKHINPNLHDGSGYTSIIYDKYLYTGTSAGLFRVAVQNLKDLSFSKGFFEPVQNTTGQTWGMAEINGKLLLGHHEGAYIVNGNKASQFVSGAGGIWNFVPLSSVFPSQKVIAGTYKGIIPLAFQNNSFSASDPIRNFTESSRYITIDKNGQIWVSHPYHGVYKLSGDTSIATSFKLYTDKQGLPSALNNHIFKIKNEVLVGTENGVYIYNQGKDFFEPSSFYRDLLGTQSIRYLKEDTEGNIWFIHEKNLGVIDFSTGKPSVTFLPELNNKMLSGFENIYSTDINNIFLGGEKGFYHINYEKYKKTVPTLFVQIRKVRINNSKTDSTVFGGYMNISGTEKQQDHEALPAIKHNWKTIRFEFSSPLYGYQSNLEYSYRLKGFEENWSEWSNRTEKEYTNLHAGNYVFEVKVRNNLGNESQVASYSFRIMPPWYQTNLAILFYLLLIVSSFFLGYKWQKNKFKKQKQKFEEEQRKLRYIHELEINKTESELITLQNEKLASEITYKNTELASSAMHLAKKGELLTKVKGELSHVMKKLDNEQAINELKKMIKSLNEDENIDQEWENFSKHFDKVNGDFILKLKEKHPTLTGNEVKLCTYLRMNLSTKEIAQLMNISVRGVEISRYRLRKKLAITTDKSLFDYFIQEFKEYEK